MCVCVCVWVVDLVAWTGVADKEIDSIHAFGDCFCRIHSNCLCWWRQTTGRETYKPQDLDTRMSNFVLIKMRRASKTSWLNVQVRR